MAEAPRILLVRFSAIGDCVMTAWAATSVRQFWPDAHLTWAVESRCAPVVGQDRLVNELLSFDRTKGVPSARRFGGLIRTYLSLRHRHFDWGVDFQGHAKTALALRIASPKKRLAVRATDALSARLNPVLAESSVGLHTVEINHRALLQFGEFTCPERPLMPDYSNSRTEKFDVVIAVGAGHPSKAWPVARWETVAGDLASVGFRVAFIGGASDPQPRESGTTNLVDKLSLAESMAAISQARCVACADTGAGHIAAAYGIPVVSVFGPTSPVRYRPFTESGVVLQNGPDTESVATDAVAQAILATLEDEKVGLSVAHAHEGAGAV